MAFRAFDPHDDACIRQAVQIRNGLTGLADEMRREEYVLVQRAFQIGAIDFKSHAHVLLSHRRDGWRSDEVDFLIGSKGLSRKSLAHSLNRSPSSVAKQLFEFRLVNGGNEYLWQANELNLLTEKIMFWDAKRIGKALHRSAIDVKHKAIAMGLTHRDVVLTSFRGHAARYRQDIGMGVKNYGTALQCV